MKDLREFARRFVSYLACVLAAETAHGQSILVEVSAGNQDRTKIPVWVELPDEFRNARSIYVQRLDTGQETPAQRSSAEPGLLAWQLDEPLPRGQSRRYRVLASQVPVRINESATCRDTGKSLQISLSGRPVLEYHTAVAMPPAGLDPVFARSGFIHPLKTPGGRTLTADFPADHAHQHGIFFAWKQTEFEGAAIDFWNQADRTGTVEHVAVESLQSGPVFAEFQVTLRHSALPGQKEPRPVLEETWIARVYARRDAHVMDLISRQRCSSASPLIIKEYHYGGMGYRGPTDWLGASGGFAMRTSEGRDRLEGNHSRPAWVDCLGELDRQPCGIRVVQHPGNFRYPQPVRLHPSKPYLVFAPEVLGEFLIEPEQVYESRYRFIAFDGAPSLVVDQMATAVATPPGVKIVR